MASRTALLRMAFAGLTLLGSGLGISQATTAHAGVVGCRTDPIVTLSNGVVVNLGATIADPATDVTGVTYTVHAPVGTSVVSVVYPLDPNGIPQTFQFFADNPAGVWDSYTLVGTRTSGIAVTSTADINGLATFTGSGLSQQAVHVQVLENADAQQAPENPQPQPGGHKHKH